MKLTMRLGVSRHEAEGMIRDRLIEPGEFRAQDGRRLYFDGEKWLIAAKSEDVGCR